ncbi:MAG: glycosyltransferase [Candidatus Absconditabacterales bacterium]
MLSLLYFGRLEHEKGFDAIIDMIETFGKKLPCELFIFGSGNGEKRIQTLANENKNIHFFGRQNLDTIKRYIANCNYCLMPSECLESFGLSALTAMKRGLPVIGYAKGGLKDFISKDLDLTHQPGQNTGEKLYTLINSLTKKQPSTFHLPPVTNYNKDSRIVHFHALAGKEVKKILIVSDFINKIGGIETYINDVKQLLEQHGYEAQICGGKLPSGWIGKLAKYLGIVTGLGNFYEAIKLHRKIKTMKPDLIRYNSVMRYLGRAPIRISKSSPAKKWMMFHDLGYFYPFPSELTDEKQIKTPLTWKKFVSSYKTHNIIKILAAIGKFTTIRLIKKQLQKKIDTFLVPSEFMKNIVLKSYKIADEKIKVFHHFIQE